MRAAVLGVVLALALARSTHAAVPVKLSLRSIDSSSILERGALTVKVVARRKGRVRVSAGTLARARTLRICGPRTRVTVKAGRKRTRRLLRRRRSCRNPPPDAVVLGPPPGGAPAPRPAGVDTPEGCDFLDPAVCLQPWPNDYFTVADAGTPTGRRLDLQREAMPKNVAGKPIEPGDQRRPDRGADAEAARRRADGALRSRAARRRLGGRPGAPARHGQALPLRLLRDRLDRDVVQRRRQRPHDPQRPLALPDAHRSPPAGAAELPLPRPAHCARGSPTSPASRDGSTPPGSSTTANSQGGITGFPSSGSVYEPWDAGAGYNALAPNANTPPVESAQNQDPHGVPRRIAGAQEQKSEHLKLAGAITDQCGGGPCDGVP